MSYQVPPFFKHGDQTASAANFQKYSDSLNALYAAAASGQQMVIDKRIVTEDGTGREERFYFVHSWRWLWYWTTTGQTGTIVDPGGTSGDVTLPDVTVMTAYDLSGVTWLTQGAIYSVTGVDYAAEDYEA